MKLFRLIFAISLLCLGVTALVGEAPKQPGGLLPKEFGGWQVSGMIKTSSDPNDADPVNAAVLQEYGFTGLESATYVRDDGRKVTIKAARFGDASGAYGAFTYYKMPQMLVEKIGDQGASLNERVLFYRGNILVDADFEKLSAMSAAELRELSSDLPLPPGNSGSLPGLPAYLPPQSYVKNSAKYVLGAMTLQKLNVPLPAELADFGAGAEVVLGNYNSSSGEALLTLISYPTPQIAGDHLRKIEAAIQAGGALASMGAVHAKRTGPIVAVVTGPLSESEAKSLLASVNYDANVTWNENTYFTKRDNVANLLVNVIYLCFIVIGLGLVAGIAFGGIRILLKKMFPDRIFDRPESMEFISLHLDESGSKPGSKDVSSSIEAI
jgi:hypothetical protein